MIAEYIDQAIMLCVGAWASGVGYGYLPALGKDPAAQQQWFARFGKLLKVIGPLLVVISIALAVGHYLRVTG